MSKGRYLTLAATSLGEVREKASRFIAHAFPIADEEDFQRQRSEIARKHHGARHICHAWVLGADGQHYRAFDAGEPAGSAGRPILRQLQGAGLTYAAIVVVRYFGGTLLGKAGLAHAFADAAKEALANNTVVERVVLARYTVHCTYAQVEAVKRDVLQCSGEIVEADYGERCTLHVAMPPGPADGLMATWRLQGVVVDTDA